MKQAIAFPFLLVLLGCATQAAKPASPEPAAEEAIVRLLDEQVRMAVLDRDTTALERLLSEQLIVNAPNNQVSLNRRAVLDLVQQGVIHYASFERTIEVVRIDGDVAIVMGAEIVRPIGNAPLAGQTVQRRFTNIWKKEDGTWRLTARHANVIAVR
ncbi:MAG TPA: nuclear transport factor 2 family protein [Thermoanaerobaculia bacterium]|nr:nuclear transport factor 2 family protein [Thermoanaerobaculia bacterium]